MCSPLQDLTLCYGLLETFDRDHFYPTLEAAIEDSQVKDAVPGAHNGLQGRPDARPS